MYSPAMSELAMGSNRLVPGLIPYFPPFWLVIPCHVLVRNWNKPDALEYLLFALGLKPDSIAAIATKMFSSKPTFLAACLIISTIPALLPVACTGADVLPDSPPSD